MTDEQMNQKFDELGNRLEHFGALLLDLTHRVAVLSNNVAALGSTEPEHGPSALLNSTRTIAEIEGKLDGLRARIGVLEDRLKLVETQVKRLDKGLKEGRHG